MKQAVFGLLVKSKRNSCFMKMLSATGRCLANAAAAVKQVPNQQARQVASVPLFIAGKKVESAATEFYDVHNPATGQVIARTPLATKAEMEEAAASCHDAWKSWRNEAPSKRARIMHKFEGAIRDSTKELAAILTEEQGKTFVEEVMDCRT